MVAGMNVSNSSTIIVLVVYFTILLSIGFIAGRRVKSGDDYAVGGRNVPGWAAALSERATDMSAYMALGLPGSVYLSGLLGTWAAIGSVIGSVAVWFLVSGKMRRDAETLEANTYVDWLAKKYPEQCNLIRLFGGIIILFFFTIYVAAQFMGGGNTLNSLLGIKPIYGILLTAAIIIPYTLYGGFGSVVYTDCLQATILFSMLIVVPGAAIFEMINNPDMVYATSLQEAFALAPAGYDDMFGGAKGLAAGIVFGNGFSWCFAYLGGLPQLNARYICLRDEKNFKLGRFISVTYILVAYVGAILIGLLGFCVLGPGLDNPEQVTPMLTMRLLPPVAGSIFITGIIAAMISTADSVLVLASSEVAENIIKPRFKNTQMTGKQTLMLSRFVTIGIAALAFALTFLVSSNFISTVVSWVWAGLGSPFAVCSMLTLYWKKYTGKAALATIIVGLVFTVFWIVSGLDAVITSMFTGIVASLITAIVATYLTQPKESTVNN